jgi:phage gpG-like protein
LWGDIPARPFLGVSDDDKDEILNIIAAHLRDAVG